MGIACSGGILVMLLLGVAEALIALEVAQAPAEFS